MAVTTIGTLIDKQDNWEIVRDQIAVLLQDNQLAQQALATTAGKDPGLWELRVFTDRANPWEQFLNEPELGVSANQSPIVNVWFESGSFDESRSDDIARQAHAAVFNVDIYGWGMAEDVQGGGQIPGDLVAARNAQRGARLVRNILMAGENQYLQLMASKATPLGPGVWQRFPQGLSQFQVELGSEAAHQVLGMRFALEVTFNDFSPQGDETNLLELVTVDIFRDSDGKLVAEADFDYT